MREGWVELKESEVAKNERKETGGGEASNYGGRR
jgi:hypothetical protein